MNPHSLTTLFQVAENSNGLKTVVIHKGVKEFKSFYILASGLYLDKQALAINNYYDNAADAIASADDHNDLWLESVHEDHYQINLSLDEVYNNYVR